MELEEFASRDDHYGNDFYTYTSIGTEESITFKIDGRTFAQITNSTIIQELSQTEVGLLNNTNFFALKFQLLSAILNCS